MKKGIIIVILAIISGILVGVLVYKTNERSNAKTPTTEEGVSFDSFLASAVTEINDLNLILTSENVSDNSSYENEYGFECKKYLGGDTAEIIDRLYALYETPFIEDGYFDLIETTNTSSNQELYVCLPSDCIPKVFDYKTATIEYEEDHKKIINFSGTEYSINYINNEWKFELPAVSCPLNQDLIEPTE